MRLWITLGIATLVGLGAGIVTAVTQVNLYPWKGALHHIGEDSPALPEIPEGRFSPRVAVDKQLYDFGVMDASATGSHDFVFTNVGTGPLKLKELDTSCSCTVSQITAETIPPGQSATVTVQWTGKGVNGHFRHTATIGTNDPDRPRVVLTVQGRLTGVTKMDPERLVFSRVSAGDDAVGRVRVYGFQTTEKRLQLVGYELDDPEESDRYEVTWEEMPLEEVKKGEPDASCGYLVTVRVKSGLPSGRFHRTIQLKTNLEEAKSIVIPVEGKVDSEVSIVGPGWYDEAGILTLGTVRGRKGTKRTLLIVVGGPHRHDVEFTLVKVFPDLLKVELGPTREASDGSVTMTPVVISVPPGTKPANYLGPSEDKMGKILIETSHPRVSRVKILVRVAVRR
ncbi:MAG TPA: DUF1573 domain-containing protein [Planctomycetes bacterium]|nr:DUF1573 domain-containing protein [Planctomycetota bacterium]